MNNLIIFVLGLALLQGQSEGFIINLINGATNVASNVVGGVVNGTLNTVNNVQTTIGLVTLGSQFLWDNALKPSLDVIHNSIEAFCNSRQFVIFIQF